MTSLAIPFKHLTTVLAKGYLGGSGAALAAAGGGAGGLAPESRTSDRTGRAEDHPRGESLHIGSAVLLALNFVEHLMETVAEAMKSFALIYGRAEAQK